MKFTELDLAGAYLVEIEPIEDERGFFARSWCKQDFATRGLVSDILQCSISFNPKRGTLRGMHLQREPFPETKLVRCTQGKIFDVIVDLRPGSTTFKQWAGVELSAENRKMLYIPPGLAHGFLTLMENSEIFYQISETYHPECAWGVRWNDPAFSIHWPEAPTVISDRDQNFQSFTEA